MVVVSSGWHHNYHYVMLRDDATNEVSLTIKVPYGGLIEKRTCSFATANDLVHKLSINNMQHES